MNDYCVNESVNSSYFKFDAHCEAIINTLHIVCVYLSSTKTGKNVLSIFIVHVNILLALVNNLSKTRNELPCQHVILQPNFL